MSPEPTLLWKLASKVRGNLRGNLRGGDCVTTSYKVYNYAKLTVEPALLWKLASQKKLEKEKDGKTAGNKKPA